MRSNQRDRDDRDSIALLDTPPVLTALIPPSAAVGDPAFTLRIRGTGFTANDVALWNGSPIPTSFVSATELTASVSMTRIDAGAVPVTVRTIGNALSNALAFTVNAEPPIDVENPPAGWVGVLDPWGRPVLLKYDEIVLIEERTEVHDQKGALWGQSPATPYRRVTLRGGLQYLRQREFDACARGAAKAMNTAFVHAADPWGRPMAIRVDDVALVEGALDGLDPHGDLWAEHPPAPYRRLTLVSGIRVYVNADLAGDLLDALGVT